MIHLLLTINLLSIFLVRIFASYARLGPSANRSNYQPPRRLSRIKPPRRMSGGKPLKSSTNLGLNMQNKPNLYCFYAQKSRFLPKTNPNKADSKRTKNLAYSQIAAIIIEFIDYGTKIGDFLCVINAVVAMPLKNAPLKKE